jgi:hypothetical protein
MRYDSATTLLAALSPQEEVLMKNRPLALPLLLALSLAGGLPACATDGSFDLNQALASIPGSRQKMQREEHDAEEKARGEAKAKAKSDAEAEVAAVAKMVPDAVAAQDIEKLERFCRDGMGMKENYDDAKKAACDSLKEMAMARLTAAECGQVVSTWESVGTSLSIVGNKARTEGMYLAGERLATCGRWDYMFTKLMHWGDGESASGRELLKRLDAKGMPVEKEFLKFIGQSPKGVLGDYSANAVAHYAEWRVAKGGAPTCKAHIAVANKFAGMESNSLIWLFVKMECREAADVVAASLADSVPATRESACVALADLGAKNKIDKMKIVAEKDGAYKVNRGVQVYWVRDTCNQAIGQLELAP